MTVYARQIARARKRVAKKGQSVIWLVRDEGTTDPGEVEGATKWRPKASDEPPAGVPVVIAFFTVDRTAYESLKGRGLEVSIGMQYGLMASVDGLTPSQKDAVNRNGEILPISTIDVLAPDGSPIIYTIIFDAPVKL